MTIRCKPNEQQTLDLFVALQRIICDLPLLPEIGEIIEFNPILISGCKGMEDKEAIKCSFSFTRHVKENGSHILFINVFKTECRNNAWGGVLGEIEWPFIKHLPLLPPNDSLIGDASALDVRVFTPSISVEQFLDIFTATSYSVAQPFAGSKSDQVMFQILAKAITNVTAIKTILEKEMLSNAWNFSIITHDRVSYYLGLLKPNDHTTCVKLKTDGNVSLTEFIVGQDGVVSLTGGNGTLTLEQIATILTEGKIMEKTEKPEPTHAERIHTAFQIFRNSSVYKTALAMQAIGKFRFEKDHYRCELFRNPDNPNEYPFTLIIRNKEDRTLCEAAIRNGEENLVDFTDQTRFSWDNLYDFLTGQYEIIPDSLAKAYEALRETALYKQLMSMKSEGEVAVQFKMDDMEGFMVRQNDTTDTVVLIADYLMPTSRHQRVKALIPPAGSRGAYPVCTSWSVEEFEEFLTKLGEAYATELPKISWDHLEMLDSLPKEFPPAPKEEPEPQFIDLRFIDVSDEWIQWYVKKHDTSIAHATREGMNLLLRLQEQLEKRIAVDGPKQNVSVKDPEPELIDQNTAELSKRWIDWYQRKQGAHYGTAKRVGMERLAELSGRVAATLMRENEG